MKVEKSVLDQLMDAVNNNPANKLMDAYNNNPANKLRMEFERILAAQDVLKPRKTNFELAMDKLKVDAKTLPMNFEFEIPQVVGTEIWSALDRASMLPLRQHVKASHADYGLEFLRISTSNHAIYRRAE
jgi:flagellar motor switch protein FliM